MKKASLWSLLVIACIVLGACWGRSTATPTPQPVATDVRAAALPATATAQPEPASGGEGGPLPEETSSIATVEPTLAAIAQITSTTTVTPTAAPPTMTLPATAAPVSPTVTTALTATTWSTAPHPLQIEVMRQQTYPGSAITFEETLAPGDNYSRYRVSYQSDGFKIYALMTVPTDPKPATGWPVIIFNHGYIPPAQYRTTERYVAYVDAIARSGYIVFKLDYRGHGSSEGTASGGYGSPDYTVDALNALACSRLIRTLIPTAWGCGDIRWGGRSPCARWW
jgi:hypothetical protein